MIKKIIIISMILIYSIAIFSEDIVDFDSENNKDFIKMKHKKKSATRAIILSSIFPGAGQFYVNKKSITAYIFPVIEIALWVGYFHYTKEGDDKEKAFEEYATEEIRTEYYGKEYVGPRYNRDFQKEVENDISSKVDKDMYNNQHFRLDPTNTQHFFEDIGKYDKYVFGWTDWYHRFAYNHNIRWAWDQAGPSSPNHKWVGNYETRPGGDNQVHAPHSDMRTKYIDMRLDERDAHDKAGYFTFGIVANHILSALDAARVTKKHNDEYLASSPIKFNLQTKVYNQKLTPFLMLSKGF